MKSSFFLFLFFLIGCWSSDDKLPSELDSERKKVAVQGNENSFIQDSGKTIKQRILPPKGYLRTDAGKNSFESYLRNLPLKPAGSKVKYYNGSSKENRNIYVAVVDLQIGSKDLHQCADAIMRLRAEYLWDQQIYDDIHFNFTNGFRVDYTEWKKGRRIVVNGNKTSWNNRNAPSNTYKDLWNYLEQIFTYAGTASLAQEMKSVETSGAQIGDALIQGGHPGHAVIIVDKAKNNETGKFVYLLAQSYMPAQELQVLQNPNNSSLDPWYNLDLDVIKTPEWTFDNNDLKRFSN